MKLSACLCIKYVDYNGLNAAVAQTSRVSINIGCEEEEFFPD